VTPPDVISQFMLAVPMWLLYEVGIMCARFVAVREDKPSDDDAEPASEVTRS
jgi:sec-independent protein translocase protein TatC